MGVKETPYEFISTCYYPRWQEDVWVDTNGGELVLVSDDDPKTEKNWTIYLMRLSIQQSLLTVEDGSQDY